MLVIRGAAIGDFILTLPAIALLGFQKHIPWEGWKSRAFGKIWNRVVKNLEFDFL